MVARLSAYLAPGRHAGRKADGARQGKPGVSQSMRTP